MPDWCCTNYAFIAKKENAGELLRLKGILKDILDKGGEVKNDFGNGWLGNVAMRHGMDWEKVSCRGHFDDLTDGGLYENPNAGDFYFMFRTETAWGPTKELWECVVEKYKGVSFVYTAEEPSNDIFINTDGTGFYFSERFLLDISVDTLPAKPFPLGWFSLGIDACRIYEYREYFDNFKSLQDYFIKITGKTFNNIEAMQTHLEDAYEDYARTYLDGISVEGRACVNIHAFTAV